MQLPIDPIDNETKKKREKIMKFLNLKIQEKSLVKLFFKSVVIYVNLIRITFGISKKDLSSQSPCWPQLDP